MEKLNEKCFDSAHVCRFCLGQGGIMSSIFDQNDSNNVPSLPTRIMALTRVQLYSNDGLPSIICHRCLYMAEKSFEFKTQCETSDAMLREYLSVMQAAIPRSAIKVEPTDALPAPNGEAFSPVKLVPGANPPESPYKRKRGRPRKEENLIFYSSPVHPSNDKETSETDEVKLVDGIESLVTVVDPRSEILSNSDEDVKKETSESLERDKIDADTARSLAIARAKAKKYMGVIVNTADNGTRTRRHLCKGCGKTFGHCSDLRKHVLVHTGERPFHCRLCGKTFSRSTNLNKHLKVHSGQKPFNCPKCPKSFASKGDVQRHLVIHSGIKPFSCHLCHQRFSRKDKLTRHVKLHDSPLSTRVNSQMNAACHMFGFYDDSSGNDPIDGQLESEIDIDEMPHVKLETRIEDDKDSSEEQGEPEGTDVESMVINIDPYTVENDGQDVNGNPEQPNDDKLDETSLENWTSEDCDLQCMMCRRVCSSSKELRRHMTNHTLDRPHECKLCGKTFTRRRELLRHENVHTGLKPHKCSICYKAFARKDKLARHVKIHSEERPPGRKMYCEICAVGFYKLNLYEDHLASHSAERVENGEHANGSVGESEEANSDDDVTKTSLLQLNQNPSITVTKSNR